MRIVVLFVFALLTTFACRTESEKESKVKRPNLEETLVGEWRNETLDVLVNSAGGKEDSVFALKVDVGKWEEVMEFKPIRTHFLKPKVSGEVGGYYSDYIALDGADLFRRTGSWQVVGDSLIMIEEGTTYRYLVELEGKRVSFTSIMDWDSDGVEDDRYFGTQIKFSEK